MIPTKKIIIPLILVVFAASFALATTWHERFVDNYEDLGIDQAVEKAIQEDNKNPDEIIKTALPVIDENEKAVLLKALFCSGAKPENVQSAAAANKLSDATLNEGYQMALTECRRQLEENFNYIVPGSGDTSVLPASPWQFK